MMAVGRAYTTAELSVNLVKGLTPKVQRVRAEGKVIHCGKQLATAEARLFGADGTLYAHALPKVDAWRQALAARPSVRDAVVPEYPQHLMEFLKRHQAHLLTLAA